MEYDIPDKHAYVFIVVSNRLSLESLYSLMRLFGLKPDEWERICSSQCPALSLLCYLHSVDLLDKNLLEKHLRSVGEGALSKWVAENWQNRGNNISEARQNEGPAEGNTDPRAFTSLDSIVSSEVFTPGEALRNRCFQNGVVEQSLLERQSSSRTWVWDNLSSSGDSRNTPISLPNTRLVSPSLDFVESNQANTSLAHHRSIQERFERCNKIMRTQSQTDLYTSVGRKVSVSGVSKQLKGESIHGGFPCIFPLIKSRKDIDNAIGIVFLQERLEEEFTEEICIQVWMNIKRLFDTSNSQLLLLFLDFFRSYLKAAATFLQGHSVALEQMLLSLFQQLATRTGAAKFKTYRILDELIQEFPPLFLLVSLTRVILQLSDANDRTRTPHSSALLLVSQEVYSDFLTLLSREDLVSIQEVNLLFRKCVNQSRSLDPLLQKLGQQIIVNFYNLQPSLILSLIRDLMDYKDKELVGTILQGHMLEEEISIVMHQMNSYKWEPPPPIPPRPALSVDLSTVTTESDVSSDQSNFILDELKEFSKANKRDDLSLKLTLPAKPASMRSFLAPTTPIISKGIISHEDSKFVSLTSKRDPKRYFSKRVFVLMRARMVAGTLRAIFREECATEFLFPANRSCVAGVEFTHTVGDCDGTYKGKRRFFCRANCAMFLQMEEVFVLRD